MLLEDVCIKSETGDDTTSASQLLTCRNTMGRKAKGIRIKLNNAMVANAVPASNGLSWIAVYVEKTRIG